VAKLTLIAKKQLNYLFYFKSMLMQYQNCYALPTSNVTLMCASPVIFAIVIGAVGDLSDPAHLQYFRVEKLPNGDTGIAVVTLKQMHHVVRAFDSGLLNHDLAIVHVNSMPTSLRDLESMRPVRLSLTTFLDNCGPVLGVANAKEVCRLEPVGFASSIITLIKLAGASF
jgi:hypothetical protein